MGLLYQFPVQEDPLDDRVNVKEGELTLKSYGLPLVFWFYLLILWAVVFFMFLAVYHSAAKLTATANWIDRLLGMGVFFLLAAVPSAAAGFFFYEKTIRKKGGRLNLSHKLFNMGFFKKNIVLKTPQSFFLTHFMDSPNLAAGKADPKFKGFANRGYHQLWAECQNGRKHFVDRHSQAGEMKKMKALLEVY